MDQWKWTANVMNAAVVRIAIVPELPWVDSLMEVDDQLDSWPHRTTCVDLVLAWPTLIVAGTTVEVAVGCSDAIRSAAVVQGGS